MRSAKVNVGDSGLASQYNNLRSDAYAASILLPHQDATPDMKLTIEAGTYYIGATKVVYAGGQTPSFAAPVSNPRIDIVTADSSGAIAITQGTEAASPAAPAYPSNKLVICEVYHRVSETAIYDADQGSNGYISNDSRSIVQLGGYVGSSSQIAVGALTGDKFASLASIPSGAGIVPTANLPPLAAPKFGGTGADGALSISSGTTTLSFGGSDFLIKNYTSVSITGTAVLAFSSPSGNGSIFIMKSQGNVTITSSANPAVDLRSMGGGWFWWLGGHTGQNGGGGGGNPGAGGGSGGSSAASQGGAGSNGYQGTQGGASPPCPFYTAEMCQFFPYLITPGASGASGGTWFNQGASHSPGAGAGSMWCECAGALNITAIFTATGNNGQNASSYGAGDGGGAGGCFVFIYNTLTANSATFNVGGGSGGNGASYNGSGGSGANGFSAVLQNIMWV